MILKSNLCALRAPAARRSTKSRPVSCSTIDLLVSVLSAKRSALRRSIVFWREESCWIKSRQSSKEPKRRQNERPPGSGARKESVPGVASCGCSLRSIARPRKKACGRPCGPRMTTDELAGQDGSRFKSSREFERAPYTEAREQQAVRPASYLRPRAGKVFKQRGDAQQKQK
jgi:hypothetical protein